MVRVRARGAMLAGLAPIAAVGTLVTGAGGSPPVSVSSSSSLTTVGRHYGQPGNFSGYSAIAITRGRAAWVFGGTNPGGLSTPVAVRWDGATAKPFRLPTGLTGFISAASASSASNVWAVSDYGGYALRWNGRTWQVAKRWQQGQITGILALGRRDVWVFGTTQTGVSGIGSWHFDGRSWAEIRGPAARVYQASGSRCDIWAIVAGRHGDQIERSNGSVWWRARTSTALNGVQPASIIAESDHDVWVLANRVGNAGPGPLVLAHWNGYIWQRFNTRIYAYAGQLAAGRRGGVLVTATPVSAPESGKILEVSVQGRVSAFTVGSSLGSGVSDVAFAPGSQSMWATGGDLTQFGSNAAIWVVRLPRGHVDRA
jgi:hypothetical protein